MSLRISLLLVVSHIAWAPYMIDGAFSKPFFRGTCRPISRARPPIRHSVSVGAEDANSDTRAESRKEAAQVEAEQLRRRAKELKAEARAMEVALGDARTDTTKRRNEECDALIAQLFAGNVTSTQVSERLSYERWSPDQVVLIVERLHERQVKALGRSAGKTKGFQIGDTSNKAEPDEDEWKRLDDQVEMLIEAADILDDQTAADVNQNHRWTGRVASSLRSRLKELRRTDEQEYQRKVAASVNAVANSNVSVQEYMSDTLGTPLVVEGEDKNGNRFNITLLMEKIEMVPMWIPSSLLPFLLISTSRVESDDVKRIRDEVLTRTNFYCTSSESISTAAIFRGNIRTPFGVVNTTMERNYTAVVFQDIQNKLLESGLSNRVQLFFWEDPEWRPGRDERELTPRPVVLAVPAEVVPEQRSEGGYASIALKTLSVSTTLLAMLAYSVSCYALNPSFFSSIVEQHDISVLIACFPIFVGVLAVQAIHEAAQYFMAKQAGIKIGLPVLLPSFQIGTFGSIMPLRSFPACRSALLDFALSGPVAGLLTSVIIMAGGILATVYASADALSQFPVVPVALFKASYFVGSMLSLLAPKTMILPSSQPVPIHPLFMIGFAGLISNALNMLPIGRLDGGRAYSAVFGPRNAALASLMTLAFMSLLSLTGMSSIAIFWGALVVLFQRQAEIPVRNDVTEVDDVRVAVYAGALALAIMALAPFPTGQGML